MHVWENCARNVNFWIKIDFIAFKRTKKKKTNEPTRCKWTNIEFIRIKIAWNNKKNGKERIECQRQNQHKKQQSQLVIDEDDDDDED